MRFLAVQQTTRRWSVAALFVCGVAALFAATLYGAHAAAKTRRAGLVVQYGNGKVVQRCIAFNEPEITGLDLLERSGLDILVDATNAIGVAICKIGRDGCDFPSEPCFCQCQGSGSPCIYWSYWRLQDGAWIYSNLGASNSTVRNGDVDGWAWGEGTQPPPAVTFEQICAAAKPTATPTETAIPPSETPPPTNTWPPPTETPLPTNTWPPTETPWPTETPLPTEMPPPSNTPSGAATEPSHTGTAMRTPPQAVKTAVAQAGAENPSPTTPATALKPTPRAARTATPSVIPPRITHTPTRAALVSSQKAKPTVKGASAADDAAPSLPSTRRVLTIALLGGAGIAGLGALLLIGALVWYWWRGR